MAATVCYPLDTVRRRMQMKGKMYASQVRQKFLCAGALLAWERALVACVRIAQHSMFCACGSSCLNSRGGTLELLLLPAFASHCCASAPPLLLRQRDRAGASAAAAW